MKKNVRTEKVSEPQADSKKPVHYVEDLEIRRNASAGPTTLAVGEEGGGGW